MTPIVIAARGGPEAKSRLAGVLGPEQRQGLTAAMLGAMLRRLGPARCHVVSPTEALLALAASLGSAPIRQRGGDLNSAFEQARATCAGPVILLPGDLPLIAPEDIDAVEAAARGADLVLSPATADGGTACIALPSPIAYRMAFGPDSFVRHRLQAEARGLVPAIVRRPALGQDIDRPEDLPLLDRLADLDPVFGASWGSVGQPMLSEAV